MTHKRVVTVAYRFEIEYVHEDHLKRFLAELAEKPLYQVSGAGVVGDKVYGYSLKMLPGGEVLDKEKAKEL